VVNFISFAKGGSPTGGPWFKILEDFWSWIERLKFRVLLGHLLRIQKIETIDNFYVANVIQDKISILNLISNALKALVNVSLKFIIHIEKQTLMHMLWRIWRVMVVLPQFYISNVLLKLVPFI